VFLAYFIADMDQIREKLTADLVRSQRSSGLAAVVFANERKGFAKNDILPLVPYWNYRSGDYVTFFFPGYVGNEATGASEFTTMPGPGPRFHDRVFAETIEEFERHSDWNYRGDTPLILCRAYLCYDKDTNEPKAFLDLNSIIEFELERALRDGAIESVEAFFEAVIKAAKDTPGGDVHWKLSDQLGTRALWDALIEAVVSKLPAGTKRVIDAIRFFKIKQRAGDT
jgi:hypothetical protein